MEALKPPRRKASSTHKCSKRVLPAARRREPQSTAERGAVLTLVALKTPPSPLTGAAAASSPIPAATALIRKFVTQQLDQLQDGLPDHIRVDFEFLVRLIHAGPVPDSWWLQFFVAGQDANTPQLMARQFADASELFEATHLLALGFLWCKKFATAAHLSIPTVQDDVIDLTGLSELDVAPQGVPSSTEQFEEEHPPLKHASKRAKTNK